MQMPALTRPLAFALSFPSISTPATEFQSSQLEPKPSRKCLHAARLALHHVAVRGCPPDFGRFQRGRRSSHSRRRIELEQGSRPRRAPATSCVYRQHRNVRWSLADFRIKPKGRRSISFTYRWALRPIFCPSAICSPTINKTAPPSPGPALPSKVWRGGSSPGDF